MIQFTSESGGSEGDVYWGYNFGNHYSIWVVSAISSLNFELWSRAELQKIHIFKGQVK